MITLIKEDGRRAYNNKSAFRFNTVLRTKCVLQCTDEDFSNISTHKELESFIEFYTCTKEIGTVDSTGATKRSKIHVKSGDKIKMFNVSRGQQVYLPCGSSVKSSEYLDLSEFDKVVKQHPELEPLICKNCLEAVNRINGRSRIPVHRLAETRLTKRQLQGNQAYALRKHLKPETPNFEDGSGI